MSVVRRRSLLVALVLVAAAAGCGSSEKATSSPTGEGPVTVRLGYFPNVTHATALAGIEKGIYSEKLRPDKLEPRTFNAGPAAVEALFADGLDAAYLGPSPAINAFAKSKGAAIRIISGSASGGASLVVRSTINQPSDLKGKKIASPQLGGTQDVALRAWLTTQGLKPDTTGGATVVPQENAQTLTSFKAGDLDGAWLPEPWATRLVQEGGAKVLVDERSLWPDGQFVTTHLVVRTKFLAAHPATVKRLVEAQVAANDFVNANRPEAQRLANVGIERITGKKLPDTLLDASWQNLTFTNDPIASSLGKTAADAERQGLLGHVNLKGIYDLTILSQVLQAAGQPPVAAS